MPSDVPRERLQDIITNIDRLRAHVRGVAPGESLDDKTRDAVERCLERTSETARKLQSVMTEPVRTPVTEESSVSRTEPPADENKQ